MSGKIFQVLALAIFAFLALSCGMVVDPAGEPAWQPSVEVRKSVDFQAGGTMAVEHTVGNIVITGWEKDSLEVVATGRSSEPGNNRQVRVYSEADLEPSIDIRQAGGVLRIRTRSLGGPWAAGGLDYAISVPHAVNLNTVKLEQGDLTISDVYGQADIGISKGNLTVKNFSGPLKAILDSGRADVEVLDIRGADAIEISTRDGDIVLRLEPDAGVRIRAEAPQGEITSEFDLGLSRAAKELTWRMGNGEAGVSLKALRGNIRIQKAG
jgi:hypothetical protein